MAKVRHVWLVIGVLAVVLVPASLAQAASSSSDVAAAEAGTIQQSDVPSDFTASTEMTSQAGPPPSASSSSNNGLSKEVKNIPACKAFVKVFQPTSKTVTASADGASFDKTEALGGASLSGSTLIFTSTSAAQKFYLPMKASALPTCLNQAMKASIKQSLSGSDTSGTFSKFNASIKKRPVPKVGDEAVDYRITLDISGGPSAGASISLKMYMDMEFVRAGRGIGAYLSMSTGTPDDTTSQSAVQSAVTRMQQALA